MVGKIVSLWADIKRCVQMPRSEYDSQHDVSHTTPLTVADQSVGDITPADG